MSYTSRAARSSTSIDRLKAAFSHVFRFAGSADFVLLPALILASACFASCGRIGPPIPPARFSERTAELAAVQRGSSVALTWPAPSLIRDSSSRAYVARADIYRLTERIDQEPVLDTDDYEQSAEVIGYLDRATIEAQKQKLGRLQFADAIDLTRPQTITNVRLRYAVRYVNNREQAAAFSNTVALEPSVKVALPPTSLRVSSSGQDRIALTWTAPQGNVDGTQPASIVGYNVYRRRSNRETAREPVNEDPISDSSFADTSFDYNGEYVYFVRALSQGASGLIESADSEPVQITPIDNFAPAAPDPISIASANGTISLFWPSSPEPDVIGYHVYRAATAEAEDKAWVRLTDQPITAVTFRDDRVVIGERYFYRVSAMDRFENESPPSKVVTETAHP